MEICGKFPKLALEGSFKVIGKPTHELGIHCQSLELEDLTWNIKIRLGRIQLLPWRGLAETSTKFLVFFASQNPINVSMILPYFFVVFTCFHCLNDIGNELKIPTIVSEYF